MAEKKRIGRPSTYSPEIAARICEEIASGKSLKKVCALAGMPAMSTVFLWIAKHPSFSENYARAQADRVVAWSEEIVDIADNSKADTHRAKLRVDTRKWLMSKMDPKKYGDRQEHRLTGANGGPIEYANLSEAEINARLAAVVAGTASAPSGGAAGGPGTSGGEGEEAG